MPQRLAQLMHLPSDALGPILGWIGAALSATTLRLAQALPPDVSGWFEGGAYLALVACLVYANVAQWRRLRERDKKIDELHQEARTEAKEGQRQLTEAIERLASKVER